MGCSINIAESLKEPKVTRLFNLAFQEGMTREGLVLEGIKRMKNWNNLGHLDSDPNSSTSDAYKFLGAIDEFNKLLNSWEKSQLKKRAITTIDEITQESKTSNLEEDIAEIADIKQMLEGVISDIMDGLEQFIRVKNKQHNVIPIINGEPFIDFKSISALVENSSSLSSLLDTKLQRATITMSVMNTSTTSGFMMGNVVPMHSFVKNNVELNDNIMGLKSRWWANIVKVSGYQLNGNALYVKQEGTWIVNPELFTEDSQGKTNYEKILENLKHRYDLLKVKSVIDSDNLSTTETYIEMLMLLNFDNFLAQKFSDYITVNPDSAGTWGFPLNGDPKYSLNKKAAVNTTWAPDSNAENDITEFESGIFKLVSSTIPFLDFETGKTIGTYLDTLQINGLASVLSRIPNGKLFTANNKSYDISTWYKKIAENQATFKEMLEAIMNDYGKDENLYKFSHAIKSIYQYLYAEGSGIHQRFMAELPKDRMGIINIESIIFNQLRNVGKAVYRIVEIGTKNKSRSIDPLLIDTLVGEDFNNLFSTLSVKWISHSKTMLQHPFWETNGGTITNFLDFLNTYGGAEFSERAIRKYKQKNPAEKFDVKTIQNLKEYLGSLKKVPNVTNEYGERDVERSAYRNITQDEWVDAVRNNDNLFRGLDLISLFKAKHNSEPYNLITSTKNSEGNNIPALSVINMASAFNGIVKDELNKTKSPENQLVLEAMEGFEVLLEVVTENGAREFSKLSANDNVTIDILNLFYEYYTNENKVLVQPWNLADKSKVLAQSINMEKLTKNVPEGEFFTSDIAKDTLYKIQSSYFSGLQKKIIADYAKVFPKAKIKNITDIENFLKGKKWSDFISAVSAYNKVNPNNQIVFIEELHFSKYKNGLAFNLMLKSQFDIWINKGSAFDEFVKYREETFLKNLGNLDLDVTQMGIVVRGSLLKNPHKIVQILKTKHGFTDEDFDLVYASKNVLDENKKPVLDAEGKPITELILTKNGEKIIEKASLKKGTEGNLSEPLKRYFWTKNLSIATITNASSKGVFIHPVKSNKTTVGDKVSYAELIKEEDERTVAFYKRMVLLGGSITRFKQGGHDGIPTIVTIATSEDPIAPVWNPSGVKDIQRTFDGGIPVSPFFSQMLIDAAPGLNLSRVMKPLGMSIQDYHMSFLKCALFGITNSMILTSMESEFSIYKWMEKMHSVPFSKNILAKYVEGEQEGITIDIQDELDGLYVPHNGEYTRIASIGILPGLHNYSIMYENDHTPHEVQISNYFQLWNLFGGALSKRMENNQLAFSESSIDLVNYIIKLQAIDGNLDFKSNMISMIIPRQAIKNGQGNTNNLERLHATNNDELLTMPFETSYFGIQLNASHDSDESNITEVTQVITALAENNTSPEYYNAVYNTISKIINQSLSDFRELGDKQLAKITNIFIRNMQRSVTANNARAVLDNLGDDLIDLIPYTDRSLFKQFISTVLSNINKEFIRKKISGAGMVLNMSHNMIKLYESNKGRPYLTKDLLQIFDSPSFIKTPEIESDISSAITEFEKARLKVRYVLNAHPDFQNVQLSSIYQINPLDIIKVNGEDIEYNLSEIDDYYNFLEKYENTDATFEKVYRNSRDLKPSQKSFSYFKLDTNLANQLIAGEILPVTQEDLNKLSVPKEELIKLSAFLTPLWINSGKPISPDINSEFNQFVRFYAASSLQHGNGFSIGTTRWKFKFEDAASSKSFTEKLKNVKALPYINDLHNYLLKHNSRYNTAVLDPNLSDEIKFKLLEQYVKKVTQRTWDVIAQNKLFPEYDNAPNYFERILALQDGTFDTLDYGLEQDNFFTNTVDLFNYVHKDAENIASKIYKTQLNLSNASHADISPYFFSKMFGKVTDRKLYKHYQVLLNNVFKPDRALQIIFSDLKSTSSYEKLIKSDPSAFRGGMYLLDIQGRLVRTTQIPGEYELIGTQVPISTEIKGNKVYRLNRLGQPTHTINDIFSYTTLEGEKQYAIFKTADQQEIAVANTSDIGDFVEDNSKYFGVVDIRDTKAPQDILYASIINSAQNFQLRNYLKNRQELSKNFSPNPEYIAKIGEIKTKYFKSKADEMFNSWKLSNTSLSARIPAQAGQSYMSMQTVGYLHDDENNVYVSHWQLWLQGSDFDIDKLYMMTFNVQNGLFVGWSPYFSLATSDDVKDSLSLPAPTGLKYSHYTEAVPDIDPNTIIDLDEQFGYLDSTKTITIADRVKILTYVNKTRQDWDKDTTYHIKTANLEIFKTIRNHNSFDSEDGLNNFKVHQMLLTSRNPRNQLIANTPVSFGEMRNLKKDKQVYLSMYDPFSMFQQQENNYVGKDVIGIAATGIKSYFSLITYYSNYFAKNDINVTDNTFFTREYTVLGKKRVVTNIAGLELTQRATTLLKEKLADSLVANKYHKTAEAGGGLFTKEELLNYVQSIDDITDPALKLSALLSAATDNAKELLLADINAGIDFSGMHIFLIIMGFDEMDIARYMTSPDVLLIKEYIKDSFINPKSRFGPDTLLADLDLTKLGLDDAGAVKATDKINTDLINKLWENPTTRAIFNKLTDGENNRGLLALIKTSNSKENFIKQVINQIQTWNSSQLLKITERKLTKTFNEQSRQDAITKLKATTNELIANVTSTFENVVMYDLNSGKDLTAKRSELENFKNIYFHAKEFVSLGSLFSMNQGIKATIEDAYKAARKISSIVSNQQSAFFKRDSDVKPIELNKIIIAYNSLDIWDSLSSTIQGARINDINAILKTEYTLTDLPIESIKKQLNNKLALMFAPTIQMDKPYLPIDYINTTLENVANAEIISKGVNHNKYFQDEDYRNLVTSYYNLIKFTTNVLDVLDKLPHFKAMTEAFQEGNSFLETNVLGYKFISEYLPKLIDIATLGEELTSYNTLKTIRNRGQKASNVKLDKNVLDKSQDTLFEVLLMSWMKNFDFIYDLTPFMVDKFKDTKLKILVDDKTEVKYEEVDMDHLKDEFKIDFATEYGRAKFKYLMDIYIIPKFKQIYKNNGFFKNLTYKTDRGFNMKRTIKFYENGANGDITLPVERGLESITKNSNNEYQIPGKVSRGSDILGSINIIDMLSIYDKIMNLKRFGGNRSTKFFDKSKGSEDSLSANLLRFQSQAERDPKFLKNLELATLVQPGDTEQMKESKKARREALYLSLFGTSWKGTKKYVVKDPDRDSDNPLESLSKGINNPYYLLVESVDTQSLASVALIKFTEKQAKANNKVKDSNGVIKQNCS